MISCINILLHPLARAFTIQEAYDLRNPFAVEQLLIKYIPENSRILGPPVIYYSCIKHHIDFRYPSPLFMEHIRKTSQDKITFEAAVKKYKPQFLVLESSVIHEEDYKFLGKVSF